MQLLKKLIISILIVIPGIIFGQKSVKIFIGGNLTKIKEYYFVNNQKVDSFSKSFDWIVQPSVGFDYNIPIKKRFIFTTGLGISLMGTANYYKFVTDLAPEPDPVTLSIKENPHFRIIYLRWPVIIKYKLNKTLDIFYGYSLNYSIRKNQNVVLPPENTDVYRYYFHTALIGVEKKLKNWSISLNSNIPINRISDTTDNFKDIREYKNLFGFHMSVGYSIFE